jgi:signal transduction histidine kinase
VRLLIILIIVGIAAIGTIALLASRATTSEFQLYLERDPLDYELFVNPFIVNSVQNYMRNIGVSIDDSQLAELRDICQENPLACELIDQENLQRRLEQMGQVSGTRIIVTNMDGFVFADSRREITGNSGSPLLKTPVGVVIVHSIPYLVYVHPLENVAIGANEQAFINAVNRSIIIAVPVAALAAILLGFPLARSILKPIRALTFAAKKLETGDLSQRVQTSSRDEIGELANAFNEMADALNRAEDLRRNMVTDVAHELRTPLSNIRGYLEAIQDGIMQPSPQIIESLHEEAILLNRLVDDLQELSLAEAGRLTFIRQPISLEDVVRNAIIAVKPQANTKNLDILDSIPSELPFVNADRERIAQVFRNLLNNAITNTKSGGEIIISAQKKNRDIEVSVQDTGYGIPQDDLQFIFERFYRADKSRSRTTGGAGLGLAIVKQLIQAHGGQIAVVSKQGWGTKFTFTLPISPEKLETNVPRRS